MLYSLWNKYGHYFVEWALEPALLLLVSCFSYAHTKEHYHASNWYSFNSTHTAHMLILT